jgi:hypothetical protein
MRAQGQTDGYSSMKGAERVFVSLTSARIAEEVAQAKEQVAFAAPGLTHQIASALAEAHGLGVRVAVVLDCNDDVCRLGYGEVQAVRYLVSQGMTVGQSPGLRVGILAVDDDAWAFTPAPLCVERERQSDETPQRG